TQEGITGGAFEKLLKLGPQAANISPELHEFQNEVYEDSGIVENSVEIPEHLPTFGISALEAQQVDQSPAGFEDSPIAPDHLPEGGLRLGGPAFLQTDLPDQVLGFEPGLVGLRNGLEQFPGSGPFAPIQTDLGQDHAGLHLRGMSPDPSFEQR